MTPRRFKLRLTFAMPLLGTTDLGKLPASDPLLVDDSLNDPLVERVERLTGFKRDPDGSPLLQAYQMVGFLKEAASALGPALGEWKLSRRVESLVFVQPRDILLVTPGREAVTLLDHRKRVSPGRGHDYRGKSTILVRSEQVPVGTEVECTLVVYPSFDEAILRELLDYGAYRGIGQWRSAGYGTFDYQLNILDDK